MNTITLVLNPTLGISYTLMMLLGTALHGVGIHLPTKLYSGVVSYTRNKRYPLCYERTGFTIMEL
jgi:hypothetical protein